MSARPGRAPHLRSPEGRTNSGSWHSREHPKSHPRVPCLWGFPRQPPGAPGGVRAQLGTWGCHLGTVSDPRRALCLLVRDFAHGVLNKAYRKVLDQLSARKYLQTLTAKGVG